MVALRAEKQGIELVYDFDANDQLLVGDPLRLSQILTNLVTNALKFSAGGNVIVNVAWKNAGAGEAELHFSVSDHRITSYNVCYTKLLRVSHFFNQLLGADID